MLYLSRRGVVRVGRRPQMAQHKITTAGLSPDDRTLAFLRAGGKDPLAL